MRTLRPEWRYFTSLEYLRKKKFDDTHPSSTDGHDMLTHVQVERRGTRRIDLPASREGQQGRRRGRLAGRLGRGARGVGPPDMDHQAEPHEGNHEELVTL